MINGIDVQNPLVNGSSIKSVNTNNLLTAGNYDVPPLGVIKLCKVIASNGTQITSTTLNTITYSILIPANTFLSSGLIDIACRFNKTGTTVSTWASRIYINTSNSLTGATLIATISNSNGVIGFVQGFRYLRIYNGNIYFLNTAIQGYTDLISYTQPESSTAFNVSADNYILLAIQKSTANAEVCQGSFCKVLGYE